MKNAQLNKRAVRRLSGKLGFSFQTEAKIERIEDWVFGLRRLIRQAKDLKTLAGRETLHADP